MLRGYTARLGKQEKLCTKFCSPSNIGRATPSIHYNNIRLIQSLIFNNNNNNKISPFISSYHYNKNQNQTYNTNPLQYFNHRRFSLPPHEIIGLPALSPSVEESKVVQWKKNEGDLVEADEAIASIQTDKAEVDWQVTDDVYLAKILLEPGNMVSVGTPTCIFVEEADMVAAFKDYNTSSASSAASSSSAPPTPPPTQPTSSSAPSTPTPPAAPQGNYPEHVVEGMPALSPTATDGAVVEWLVKEGDMIEEGSGIAEIQTDKSVVTWTSTDQLYVAKLLVAVSPDDRLPVGTPLAVFCDEKEDVIKFKDFVVGSAAPAATPTPAASTPSTPAQPQKQATPSESPKATTATGGRVIASPYAKKIASEMGIDLSGIGTGSGPKGRIVANDVMAAKSKAPAAPKVADTKKAASKPPQPVRIITGDRTFEDVPVSVMREIIGKRLSESKFSSPHFYVTMECIIDSLTAMRKEMNEGETNKISVNDFVIKASAMALRDIPDCNVGWITNTGPKPVMRKYNYIDISVAVATPSGLITPIIKDVDRKTLSEISAEMKDLGRRAKDNKLLPEEFQGGTFTISNMGMFGVTNFTAIINPPQACILAVGGAKKILKPDDSNTKGFKNSTAMQVTLSSDHRSVDGALAALWVNAFQKYIEKPSKLMM